MARMVTTEDAGSEPCNYEKKKYDFVASNGRLIRRIISVKTKMVKSWSSMNLASLFVSLSRIA